MPANTDLERRHLPDVDDPELRPFWEGCRAGELRIPRCGDCAKLVWYPRLTCPRCDGRRMGWSRVSGRGRLFTWVHVRRAFLPGFEKRVPYTTALVELEEDAEVRLATLLDHPPDVPLHLGLAVEVHFEAVDSQLTLPRFRIVVAAPTGRVAP